MTTTKEKLISQIKSIIKEKYDVKTLREAIAVSSTAAVKDLIKKNPNIDLNTLKKSLRSSGHGGYQQITQQDVDSLKTSLGIRVVPAQPKPAKAKTPRGAGAPQANPNAPATANTGAIAGAATPPRAAPGAAATNPQAATATSAPGTPQPAAPIPPPAAAQQPDNKIEKTEIDAAKQLPEYVQFLPKEYVDNLNKSIASFGITNVNDIQTAEKFIDDYLSVIQDMEDYKGLIHVLSDLTNKEEFPSPKQAQPQAAGAQPGQQPQGAQGQPTPAAR